MRRAKLLNTKRTEGEKIESKCYTPPSISCWWYCLSSCFRVRLAVIVACVFVVVVLLFYHLHFCTSRSLSIYTFFVIDTTQIIAPFVHIASSVRSIYKFQLGDTFCLANKPFCVCPFILNIEK